MKKIITLVAFIICINNLKAQFVTIPDANFVSWLQTYIPSAMSGNQMDTTDVALISYKQLSVNNNIQILFGIQYFDSLTALYCNSNSSITNLPMLPNSLEVLICSEMNALTNLPTLPPNLKELFCNRNNFSSLPSLPNTLETLS